jgi:hypothetical protein
MLPLNLLPFVLSCTLGHILLITLLSSALDALMETLQSSGLPPEATSLTPIL